MAMKFLVSLALVGALWGQLPTAGTPQAPATAAPKSPTLPQGSALERLRPNYVLQPGDQILVRAFEMEEVSDRPYLIDGDGFITMPILGRVKAAGLSVEKFEATLVEMLRQYVRQPQVTVTVTQFSSEPVFFIGAFNQPGIYPLSGKRTLVEMMAVVGGLAPTASRRLKVTRRIEQGRIPLPSAQETPDGKGTFVDIDIKVLRENVNPAEDLVLQPFDVISAERAEVIYMTGGVGRQGPLVLEERESITLMKAIAMSGGTLPSSKLKEVRVLRPVMDTNRRAEIRINLKDVGQGRVTDFPLMPDDIVYVPVSSIVGWQGWLALTGVATSALWIVLAATR